MSASATRAVLLDFGGTLDADGVHWCPRFHAAYRAAGGTLERAAFEPVYREADRALAGQPGLRALGFRATIEIQARLLRDRLPDGARLDAHRVAAWFVADTLPVIDRNRGLLARLAAVYRLAVVSNFTGNLTPCLEELDLLRFFTVASDSSVVGVAKPDAGIFLRTLRELKTPPRGAWMVGDNIEADLAPAAALGMRTCWVAPPDRAAPLGSVPTARVARLPDLARVLD